VHPASAGKKGEVIVDEYSRTSVPSIWAVGDVTDRINLTPVALMEGMAVAKTVVLNQPTKPDYLAVPSAVFSWPNIATVVGARREWGVRGKRELGWTWDGGYCEHLIDGVCCSGNGLQYFFRLYMVCKSTCIL
jgi:hypothetical protein